MPHLFSQNLVYIKKLESSRGGNFHISMYFRQDKYHCQNLFFSFFFMLHHHQSHYQSHYESSTWYKYSSSLFINHVFSIMFLSFFFLHSYMVSILSSSEEKCSQADLLAFFFTFRPFSSHSLLNEFFCSLFFEQATMISLISIAVTAFINFQFSHFPQEAVWVMLWSMQLNSVSPSRKTKQSTLKFSTKSMFV